MSTKNYYVDKKKFYDQIRSYLEKRKDAESKGEIPPRMPNQIGKTFLDIARNVARLPRFSNYTYIEDMIQNAVENCVNYVDKFDYEKYRDPFSYFSTTVFRSFIRSIKDESVHSYLRAKLSRSQDFSELSDDDMGLLANMFGSNENDDEIIRKFEDRLKRDKERKKMSTRKSDTESDDGEPEDKKDET